MHYLQHFIIAELGPVVLFMLRTCLYFALLTVGLGSVGGIAVTVAGFSNNPDCPKLRGDSCSFVIIKTVNLEYYDYFQCSLLP